MSGDDTAFLESDPPHWAARGLSTIIIVLFVLMLLAAALVHVPETVSGRFTLVPITGTDPVRTAREGIVTSVRVHEGDSVTPGAPLFIVRCFGTPTEFLVVGESQLGIRKRLVSFNDASK